LQRSSRRSPFALFSVIFLLLFACLLIGLNWYFFPHHFLNLAKLIGPNFTLLLIALSACLVVFFVYCLFKRSRWIFISFSVTALAQIAYATFLLQRVVSLHLQHRVEAVSIAATALVKSDAAVVSVVILVGALMALVVIMITVLMLLMQRMAKQLRDANENLKIEMQEREKAQAARDEMKAALQQSQKLEALGTFAGGIAHNFNNILYSIQGYTALTRDGLEQETVPHRNLGKVLEATKSAQELVSGIADFSRISSSECERISIEKVLTSSIDLLKVTMPGSVELQVSLSIEGLEVIGNYAQLQQVIINVVRNAVDAVSQAGTICVHASGVVLNEALLSECHRLASPAYVVIRIVDDGVGMDEETLQRIFEPFYTTKDVGKGTGLGLATSRSIIEDHKGEFVVNSVVGKGSEFTIFIPQCQNS
jgi:signal transduction histidine kinase